MNLEQLSELIKGFSTTTQDSRHHALLIMIAGLLLTSLVIRIFNWLSRDVKDQQLRFLVRRITTTAGVSVTIFVSLQALNIGTATLLAFGGLIGLAVGFASQTSMSNLVSGMFLLVERSFSIGDLIDINGTTGYVLSVDLLSVKLRKFDNTFVRIPNESMLKSQVTTLTKFPIRRIDLQLGVAYKEDLGRVKALLFDLAKNNPLSLDEPEPIFIFLGFGDSSLDIQFSVWADQSQFLGLRTSLQMEIKAAFDEAGIEIPFPHRTIYTGSVTQPFPLSISRTVPTLNGGHDDGMGKQASSTMS